MNYRNITDVAKKGCDRVLFGNYLPMYPLNLKIKHGDEIWRDFLFLEKATN